MKRAALFCAATLGVAGCAAPPLKLYTLTDPPAAVPQFGPRPLVIGIARVGVPDELDNEDILVQNGSVLRRSATGRRAGRLSIEITDMLTQHFAAQRPDALVTDRPQIDQPAYRIAINLGQFTVMSDGSALVTADWQVLPRDASVPITRYHAQIKQIGPVATDDQVIALQKELLGELARAIDIKTLK